MNRILKFRLWSDEEMYLLTNDGMTPKKGNFVSTNRLECYDEGILMDIMNRKGIITQFTGLLDKNGKEIYEGDIVNFTIPGHAHGMESEDYENLLVKWDEEAAQWGFWGKGVGEFCFSICGDRIDTESFEIVGNMFENGDLLK